MFTKSGYTRRSMPIFIGIYLASFLLYYISYLMYYEWGADGAILNLFNYISTFYIEGADFVAPVLMGCAMLPLFDAKGLKYTFIRSILFALPHFIYVLLSRYIGATMSGSVFGEAMLYAFIYAFGGSIIFLLQGALIFFILKYLRGKLKGDGTGSVFDFSTSIVKALFIACALKFAVMLGIEIYTAVEYLTENAGYYKIFEIIYMILRFLFVLSELIVSHILGFKLIMKLNEIYTQPEPPFE